MSAARVQIPPSPPETRNALIIQCIAGFIISRLLYIFRREMCSRDKSFSLATVCVTVIIALITTVIATASSTLAIKPLTKREGLYHKPLHAFAI